MGDSYFSATYAEARDRFLTKALVLGAAIETYPIVGRSSNQLMIDVAVLGERHLPTVVISSGVHGVEGFVGSAIQLALLDRIANPQKRVNVRYVLMHAVNPYGFAYRRRFNEDNVDLNRNFLVGNSQYSGSPASYDLLNGFLNPPSPPSRFEPFKLLAAWYLLRHGRKSLMQAIAGGQYEHPRGVFFGGKSPSQSMLVVREHVGDWIGESQRVVHLDVHSGLGRYGNCKLLLTSNAQGARLDWYMRTFGPNSVDLMDTNSVVPYYASGTLGEWMEHRFSDRDYRFITTEFGTYDSVRVLAAIRAENRAHHNALNKTEICRSSKDELLECFCPRDLNWRRRVIASGLQIVDQSVTSLCQ